MTVPIRTTTALTIARGERLEFDFTTTSNYYAIMLAAQVTTYSSPGPPPTATGPIASLFNSGEISVLYGGTQNSFIVFPDTSVPAGSAGTQVFNDGVMRITAPNGSATGVTGATYRITVVNRGDVIVNGLNNANAILGYGITVENSGRIEATGAFAFGIGNANFAGSVVNSGTIRVIGSSGAGGITMGLAGGTVTNTGLIDVSVTNPLYGGTGIAVQPMIGGLTVINRGDIRAVHAIVMVESGDGSENVNRPVSVDNSGRIFGNIELGAGISTVINSGVIDGNIWLGSGADLFDGRLGVVTGTVDAGAGTDTVLGGRNGDVIFGRDGSDRLVGGLGDDFLIGGNQADVVIGGSGHDLLDGGYGIDTADYSDATRGVTVDLGRRDAQDTGQGLDTLVAVENVSGGVFDDILTGAAVRRPNDARLTRAQDTPNHSITTALSIDGLFGLDENPDVANEATPHLSIVSTMDGPAEYYRFTVDQAGAVGTFDVDRSPAAERLRISIFDANGLLIARSLEGSPANDPGSTNALDPFISQRFSSAGVYYIMIDTTFPVGLTRGGRYTLQVSLDGAPTTSDQLVGSTLDGGGGNDRLIGTLASDTLIGGDGRDVLVGGGGSDTLSGGNGTDTFAYLAVGDSSAAASDLILDFQSGLDRIDVSQLGVVVLRMDTTQTPGRTVLSATTGTGDVLTIQIVGAVSASDVIQAATPNLVLDGSAGADILVGGLGADRITGGAGADILTGSLGTDVFRYLSTSDSTATASDTITDFLPGVDRIDLTALTLTSVSVARLDDGSSVVFAESPGGAFQLFVQGASVSADDVLFVGAFGVYVIGSQGADTIGGSSRPDPLVGNGGDDILTGGAGADAIAGGAGHDLFRYVSWEDSNQTNGFDNLYDFTTGEDRIDLSAMAPTSVSILRSDNGSSFIYAETREGVFLTTAAGRVVQATDVRYGPYGIGAFGIYMIGSNVADVLVGTSLADPLYGRAGDDTITGGGGADAMFGDSGADTFVYVAASDSTQAATDGIFGFVSGVDRLDLTRVRTGAFDTFGIAYLQGGSFLFVDLGGNGTTDMVIGLASTTLLASDIVWSAGGLSDEPPVKEAGPQILPGADEVDLFDTDAGVDLSPMTGRFMLDLNPGSGRGFYHGQDWYL